jgi:hypothetical protein
MEATVLVRFSLAAANINSLTHFLEFGIHEGRSPFADGHFG